MAFNEWTAESRLTPGGWKSGAHQYGIASKTEIPRPEDAVETWIERGYQRSGWGREECTHWRSWFDASVPEKERDRLRSQFPSPFTRGSTKRD
jgi:hypothetical protein